MGKFEEAQKAAEIKSKEKWTGRKTTFISFLFLVGFFSVLFLFMSIEKEISDANTNIVDAEVIGSDKTKGGRRALPNYSLTILEKGASEPRKISVDMVYWVMCKPGYLYTDVPGSEPRCVNPKTQETLDNLRENTGKIQEMSENLKDFELTVPEIPPYIPPIIND